jgi:glycyl-tRNA synthetase beta chain
VDAFFNAVMVLCDDVALRRNRMALLASIQSIYDRVADFSALQI